MYSLICGLASPHWAGDAAPLAQGTSGLAGTQHLLPWALSGPSAVHTNIHSNYTGIIQWLSWLNMSEKYF